MRKSLSMQVLGVVGAAFTAVVSFIVAIIPAGAMTVTFVRHGESQANADGIINTEVPGPGLTDLGWNQSRTVAGQLPASPSGIYASTMTRTQQTATPYAARIKYGSDTEANEAKVVVGHAPGSDVVVLDGLQEINAGIFEGSSEDEGIGRIGYALAPIAWSLGLRFVRIPGSEDGNEFDARVDKALEQMNGDDPVVFSHGATIMFWTMMNVDNPDLTLLLTHQLDNTETVVVEKNDDGSWTLKSWGGEAVGPADLPTQLFVNTRDLIVAPQTALYNFSQNPGVDTGVKGVEDVAGATVKFATDTVERSRQCGAGAGFFGTEQLGGSQAHREGSRCNGSHRRQQGDAGQHRRRRDLEEQRSRDRGHPGCPQRDLHVHQESRRGGQEGRGRREGCGVFDRQQGRRLR